jgi:D-serine deaminase-like pyridoxal phosphate-dependent protein
MTTPQTIYDLETPSVLIDLDIVERNIATMQARADQLGRTVRPHIKTHKNIEIAQMQRKAGAKGICCQKSSEAQVFADAGFDDILISYNVIGGKKLARLASMARDRRITIAADHLMVIEQAGEAARAHGVTLRILIDLITNLKRTGAPVDQVVDLAQCVRSYDHLEFAGLMIYCDDSSIRPDLQRALAALDAAGIPVETVSGGGTGVAVHADELPEVTELRTGSYIFSDMRNVGLGWSKLEDCAMSILATVISTPLPDRVMLDSGSKTLSSDAGDMGHGLILQYPDARIFKLNEEHAHVDVSKCAKRPQIGEQVRIIPWHTCTVTNMHDQLYGVRGERIERMLPVAARGKVW